MRGGQEGRGEEGSVRGSTKARLRRIRSPEKRARSRTPDGNDVPDDLAVNGTRDAVLQLEVHLGNRVFGEDGGIRDITCERLELADVSTYGGEGNGW